MPTSTNLDTQFKLAAEGWHLFPVGRDKKPLTEHGFKDATVTQQGIKEYAAKFPGCNWAGYFPGQLIIDIDDKHDGYNSLEMYQAKYGDLPKTKTHRTGGGGLHHIYKQPAGYDIRNTVAMCGLPGIDRRGNGGYIVLPGSIHESGKFYEVIDDSPIIEAPACLLTDSNNGNGHKTETIPGDIPAGQRNATLASLAGSMRSRGLTQSVIETALLATNASQCKPPLSDSEVLAIAGSISRYQPGQLKEVIPGDYNLTDAGNAERLIAQHGNKLHYSYDRKQWILWNGKRWEWIADGRVCDLALETIRSIYHQAADEPDKVKRQELLSHAKKSESEGRLSGMLTLAQTRPGVSIKIDQLDTNQFLLNVNNGTIDLRTGLLKTHDRHDYITSFIPVDYDPTSKSDLWDNTLDTIFEGVPAVRVYVQRGIGYSATGCQDEQVVFFPYGPGGNGKSTLLSAIRNTLGSDYATEIEPTVFMVKQHESSGPNEGVARLYRARLVISTEIEDGQRLSVSLIKRMTGGEKLHHEKKFEHGFEFTPTHKLWLSGNHKTIITDTTLSIWRRVKFINFNVTIPDEKRIKNLAELLKAPEHQKAILAWIVAGAVAWAKEGLGEPPEVTAATQAYRQEMDLLAEFLNESCLIKPVESITVAELYKAYKVWCEKNDSFLLGKNKFNQRVAEKGFSTERKTGNKLNWNGIRLLNEEELKNLKEVPKVTPPKIEEKNGKVTIQPQSVTSVTENQQSFLVNGNSIELSPNQVTKVTKVTILSNDLEIPAEVNF